MQMGRMFHAAMSVALGVCVMGRGLTAGPVSSSPGDIFHLGQLGTSPSYTNYSNAYAINDAAQVVGQSKTQDGRDHAFLYSGPPGSGPSMVDLGTLGGSHSRGDAINDSGDVAGFSLISGDNFYHAFIYTGTPGSGGQMFDLGTLGGTDSYGYAINSSQQVAGYSGTTTPDVNHAFLYTGTPGAGTMADLGTLGGTYSYGFGINNAGQVVGESPLSPGTARRAFLYSGTPGAGGAMEDLGTLGGTGSIAYGINDLGFVVGAAERSSGAGGAYVAALWQNDPGHTIIDLDTWLDVNNPTLGAYWTLTEAYGINNNGLITGIGDYYDGPGGLSDGERAFILDASSVVPEPASLGLVPIGALALLRRWRAA